MTLREAYRSQAALIHIPVYRDRPEWHLVNASVFVGVNMRRSCGTCFDGECPS